MRPNHTSLTHEFQEELERLKGVLESELNPAAWINRAGSCAEADGPEIANRNTEVKETERWLVDIPAFAIVPRDVSTEPHLILSRGQKRANHAAIV